MSVQSLQQNSGACVVNATATRVYGVPLQWPYRMKLAFLIELDKLPANADERQRLDAIQAGWISALAAMPEMTEENPQRENKP